jgi:hypothetical protein
MHHSMQRLGRIMPPFRKNDDMLRIHYTKGTSISNSKVLQSMNIGRLDSSVMSRPVPFHSSTVPPITGTYAHLYEWWRQLYIIQNPTLLSFIGKKVSY